MNIINDMIKKNRKTVQFKEKKKKEKEKRRRKDQSFFLMMLPLYHYSFMYAPFIHHSMQHMSHLYDDHRIVSLFLLLIGPKA